MAKYLLSPEAQNSLKQIKKYSNDQFGKQRTRAYLKEIMNRFRDLAANPSLGTKRSELNACYRSSFVGSHTIYFRTKSSHIEIIDVLHQSMEPTKHLLEDTK